MFRLLSCHAAHANLNYFVLLTLNTGAEIFQYQTDPVTTQLVQFVSLCASWTNLYTSGCKPWTCYLIFFEILFDFSSSNHQFFFENDNTHFFYEVLLFYILMTSWWLVATRAPVPISKSMGRHFKYTSIIENERRHQKFQKYYNSP